MRKYILLLAAVFLFGENYKIYKVIELLHEMEQKKIKFLPLKDYNVFPIHIDNKIKIKQYVKAQASDIKLKAISGKEVYINNKWYKEGEKMQNLTILKITKNCVFFISDNLSKKFSICLSPNLIKVDK